MMRDEGWMRSLCVLLLGGALVAGCKKDQPPESMSVDAGAVAAAVADAGVPDAGAVAKVAKPLRFSEVVFKRGSSQLDVTYTLTNPGTAQGRGDACLALLDEQGFFIRAERLGNIAVKGGTDDVFTDDVPVDDKAWEQARTVLLFTAAEYSCDSGALGATSEPLRLLPSGRPAPADVPAARRPDRLAKGELQLSDVTLEQPQGDDRYVLTYTLKNVSARRIHGNACLEGHEEQKGGEALFTANVAEISLAPGATETRIDDVTSVDGKDWDTVALLALFVDEPSCFQASARSAPVRFAFKKPAGIHAPEDEVTGMDESDNYDPGEEFPQRPPESDDASEETAD
ncbi:hypothetical protein [Corallococcus sp. AB038B]|uniref:hypothetical protein n=1 Tax=Corallococcus sp. AB038B TaxID=2316718 RepID=UPI0011C45E3F|nr:hypothetical protein [Corallococcus sp. AB038B]